MHSLATAIPIPAALLAATLALAPRPALGRDYPGCPRPADTDFRKVEVVTRTGHDLKEPVKFDFAMDAEGNVDIYYVEKAGRIRRYNGKTKLAETIGTIPSAILYFGSGNEHGVNGIALDPGFRANRRVWINYSARNVGFHVSRFTLDGAGMLDMASEKLVIRITAGTGWHTGGAMRFDPDGNLFVSVGENGVGEAGAPNTNDLRGKILRVRPRDLPDGRPAPAPGAGSTYDIPEGNLFKPGTEKTRPEIYVMGVRNAYTLDYDGVDRRLVWGCVGPDNTGRPTEEHNMAATPGNYGWPYFAGANEVLSAGKDPAKPVNTAQANTGLTDLPPARGAVNAYGQSAAITGPVYRYTNTPSSVKLPPHFDGVWFASDFNKGVIDTIGPKADLTGRVGYQRVFPNLRVDRPVDLKQGPDGALYVLNYAGYFSTVATTSIARIEYTGSCRPVSLAPAAGRPAASFAVRGWAVAVRGAGMAAHRVSVADLRGRTVHASRGEGAAEHDLAGALRGRAGVYLVTVESAAGREARRVALPAL